MQHSKQVSKDLARAVMLAMGAVSAFSAQATTLYGGGATLPGVGYEGTSAALGISSTPATRWSLNTTDTHSLFGAYKSAFSATVSYCQTGSGTGKKVLAGSFISIGISFFPSAASNACGDFSGTPLGFSAPSGQLDPDFVASDAPLTQSEYTAVITSWGTSHSAPVQFPVVAGAVAIVYNSGTLGSISLALNETQVCQIFSGQISNWSQLGFSPQALTVIYRSDGSGTTFSLTNHLSAICGSLGALPAGKHYITDQTFTVAYGSIGTLPSFFVGASGDPEVMRIVAGTFGSIGYGSVADAVARSPAVPHATVANLHTGVAADPLNSTDFPATYSVTTTIGQVISDPNQVDSNGRPVLANVIGSPGASQAACLVVAVPSSYADPASGYPIVAVTNLLGYYNGNRNPTQTAELLAVAYNTTLRGGTFATDIGAGKGLSYLSNAAIGTWSGISPTGIPTAISNCVH